MTFGVNFFEKRIAAYHNPLIFASNKKKKSLLIVNIKSWRSLM